MSITVRLWDAKELQQIEEGNEWLLTLFVNMKTFTKNELQLFLKLKPKVKEYLINFDEEELGYHVDSVFVNAPNVEMLKKFLTAEYNINLASLTVHHHITKYEEVEL